MSKQITGYVVRATIKTGEPEEHRFPGTGWETIRDAQDKERELLDRSDVLSVYLGALYADQLPPPQPSQATRHRREIAS